MGIRAMGRYGDQGEMEPAGPDVKDGRDGKDADSLIGNGVVDTFVIERRLSVRVAPLIRSSACLQRMVIGSNWISVIRESVEFASSCLSERNDGRSVRHGASTSSLVIATTNCFLLQRQAGGIGGGRLIDRFEEGLDLNQKSIVDSIAESVSGT